MIRQRPDKRLISGKPIASYPQLNSKFCNFAASCLSCCLPTPSFVPAPVADNNSRCGMTINRGPRGFFCLHVFRRGPVNVAVIWLGVGFKPYGDHIGIVCKYQLVRIYLNFGTQRWQF